MRILDAIPEALAARAARDAIPVECGCSTVFAWPRNRGTRVTCPRCGLREDLARTRAEVTETGALRLVTFDPVIVAAQDPAKLKATPELPRQIAAIQGAAPKHQDPDEEDGRGPRPPTT